MRDARGNREGRVGRAVKPGKNASRPGVSDKEGSERAGRAKTNRSRESNFSRERRSQTTTRGRLLFLLGFDVEFENQRREGRNLRADGRHALRIVGIAAVTVAVAIAIIGIVITAVIAAVAVVAAVIGIIIAVVAVIAVVIVQIIEIIVIIRGGISLRRGGSARTARRTVTVGRGGAHCPYLRLGIE